MVSDARRARASSRHLRREGETSSRAEETIAQSIKNTRTLSPGHGRCSRGCRSTRRLSVARGSSRWNMPCLSGREELLAFASSAWPPYLLRLLRRRDRRWRRRAGRARTDASGFSLAAVPRRREPSQRRIADASVVRRSVIHAVCAADAGTAGCRQRSASYPNTNALRSGRARRGRSRVASPVRAPTSALFPPPEHFARGVGAAARSRSSAFTRRRVRGVALVLAGGAGGAANALSRAHHALPATCARRAERASRGSRHHTVIAFATESCGDGDAKLRRVRGGRLGANAPIDVGGCCSASENCAELRRNCAGSAPRRRRSPARADGAGASGATRDAPRRGARPRTSLRTLSPTTRCHLHRPVRTPPASARERLEPVARTALMASSNSASRPEARLVRLAPSPSCDPFCPDRSRSGRRGSETVRRRSRSRGRFGALASVATSARCEKNAGGPAPLGAAAPSVDLLRRRLPLRAVGPQRILAR